MNNRNINRKRKTSREDKTNIEHVVKLSSFTVLFFFCLRYNILFLQCIHHPHQDERIRRNEQSTRRKEVKTCLSKEVNANSKKVDTMIMQINTVYARHMWVQVVIYAYLYGSMQFYVVYAIQNQTLECGGLFKQLIVIFFMMMIHEYVFIQFFVC